jgi:hypothetical protein
MWRVKPITALCVLMWLFCACVAGGSASSQRTSDSGEARPEEELEAYRGGGTFSRYGQKVVVTIAPSGSRTISGYLPGAPSPWFVSKEQRNGDVDEMEDRNGDGVWDSFRTIQQNATGYHSLERIDHDGDNTPDEVIEENVNAPQHERTTRVTRYFRAADGTWESSSDAGRSAWPEGFAEGAR